MPVRGFKVIQLQQRCNAPAPSPVSGYVSMYKSIGVLLFPVSFPPALAAGGISILGVSTMHNTVQKRFYSPQFSELSAVSVRRLAWSLGVSMPKAVDQVVNLLPSLFPSGLVCLSCKDNTKCRSCAFSQQAAATPAAPAV
jgi:hypothetical protein